jgi:antirestriction protein ArdC
VTGRWPREARGHPSRRTSKASRSCQPARADVYSRITAEIVVAVQAGAGECRMPLHHDGTATARRPTNVASGKRYRGINTLVLWAAASRAGYTQ